MLLFGVLLITADRPAQRFSTIGGMEPGGEWSSDPTRDSWLTNCQYRLWSGEMTTAPIEFAITA